MATRTGVGRDLSPVKKGIKVPNAGGGAAGGGAAGRRVGASAARSPRPTHNVVGDLSPKPRWPVKDGGMGGPHQDKLFQMSAWGGTPPQGEHLPISKGGGPRNKKKNAP